MDRQQTISYTFTLGDYINFLDVLYGCRDDAIIKVTFLGDGFVFYLGDALPGGGIVSGCYIDFPANISVNDLKALILKRRLDDNE